MATNPERDMLRSPVEAVVIGCSAGGLAALRLILADLPAKLGATVIVVAHMSADSPNLLPKLLQAHCRLPVEEAAEKAPVLPDHVYIAPPNYHLLVEDDRHFSLSVDERVCYVRPSVDVLFLSAADVYRERLLGIILTGANSDGALGLKTIGEAGGLTLVEDPAKAFAEAMPQAAIATGAAVTILPLDAMAREIISHCHAVETP